jgi:hypothetical protein
LEIAEDGSLELLDQMNAPSGGASEALGDQQSLANENHEAKGATLPVPSAETPEGTAPAAHHCPSCGAQMKVGAVICVSCGFDLRTGRRYETVTERRSGGPGFSVDPPDANVGAVGYDEPRVPGSVVVAVSILGLTILSFLLQLSQSLKLERHDNLLTDPKIIAVQTVILVLIMVGLCKGSRLAWHAARVLLILGLALYVLVALAASATQGRPPALVFLLLPVPGVAMLVALSQRSAREYFRAVCPRCGSGAVKPLDLLYRRMRCRDCGHAESAQRKRLRHQRRRMPWTVRIPVLLLALPVCALAISLLSALTSGASSAGAPSAIFLALGPVFAVLCVALCRRWRWAWHVTRWFALLAIAYEAASMVAAAASGVVVVGPLVLALGLAIPPIAILVSLQRRSAREYFACGNAR